MSFTRTRTPIGIFGPMIPFAAANRIRLILVNRRDYPGSTPLSDAELATLGSSDMETRAKALAQQGTDIGLFLAWLVREEKIPAMSVGWSGKQQGGIVLVAWSLAHTPLAGFLAHADTLPADVLRTLEPCLRAYCIFGEHTRQALLGPRHNRPSSQTRRTFRSGSRPSASTTRSWTRRIRWSSAYRASTRGYRRITRTPTSHAGRITCAARYDAAAVPRPALRAPRDARRDRPRRACGRLVARPHPGLRGAAARHAARSALEQTRRMLLDPEAGRTLPRCKVVVVWGENTLWEVAGAAWAVEKLYKEHEA
ncbi:hypothetical protein EDB85DRAFT_2198778 [Lactarius pseudohatsudake]|nr:hypothetical protein EDB85DRAFT_2219145 [Lactarius pseudohatsudake]KAH9018900.1 hypothetical protein EDB85DRAFT_2198778 [Lactarius pseudohatsudake]